MRIHPTARIDPSTRIYGNLDGLAIGPLARIDAGCVLTIGPAGMEIGQRVHVGANCVLIGSGGRIHLMRGSGLSPGVMVFTATEDIDGPSLCGPCMPDELRSVKTGNVTVDEFAVVFAGSIILPGCGIGRGAVVGAQSLVRLCVAPFAVMVGRKIIRYRDAADMEALVARLDEIDRREGIS